MFSFRSFHFYNSSVLKKYCKILEVEPSFSFACVPFSFVLCPLSHVLSSNIAWWHALLNAIFVIFLFFRLLRRIGQSGDVQVTWSITVKSPGNAPSPASTFNVSSGLVTMPDGVEIVMLPIMVSQTRNAIKLLS